MPRKSKGARLYLDPARGGWVIRDGARFIRLGCSEAEHRRAEKQLANYLAKKHKPESGPDPLIADVLLVYAQEHVPHTKAAANTAYNISSLGEWFGGVRLSALSAADCRRYAGNKSASGARRDLETLRAAISYYAREHGPIASSAHIVLPAKSEPRDRWLTRSEAHRLRKAAMKWPHLYRFVIMGLYTGSRSGVLTSLQWNWIDLNARVMLRRAPGAAEDARKRTPPVRLGKALVRLLRLWKRQDGGSGHVIHYGGKPVKRLKRVWALACKKAKLKDVSPHTLRHTRATWLMQSGVDPWEAAGHLGMSLEMLTRTYGKHSPDFQEKAAEV